MNLCRVDRLTMLKMKKDTPNARSMPVYFSFDEVTGIAEVWPLPDHTPKDITMEIDGE